MASFFFRLAFGLFALAVNCKGFTFGGGRRLNVSVHFPAFFNALLEVLKISGGASIQVQDISAIELA
jgi:hypothetical protein